MRFGFSWLKGEGLKARALRGTGMTVAAIAGENLLRLLSNLVLTRLLFPEAFGMMALVQTFIQGLKMLSDTGVIPSIVRSDRGDDPDFLNTAWMVQIARGVLLWLGACALALPAAGIYGEPMLAQILPVTGLSVLISGFATTKVATARRHLALGRLTAINLGTQVLGILVTIVLAWAWQTVWALVAGGLVTALATVAAQHFALPGIRNRFHWDSGAFRELFGFGVFIFLSSALGFVMNQGHKLVLGAYLAMGDFGVYNIGAMLAVLPFMVSNKISDSVVFPLYRHRPVAASAANRRNVFRARRLVIAASLGMAAVLAFAGVPLVDLVYDPRYAMAGPVVTLMCFALVPQMVVGSYVAVFLAAGDSRSQFLLVLAGACLQILLLFLAVNLAGTFGVILVPLAVNLLLSPLRIYLLRRHQGWDPAGDVVLSSAGCLVTGLACWLYWDRIVLLIG